MRTLACIHIRKTVLRETHYVHLSLSFHSDIIIIIFFFLRRDQWNFIDAFNHLAWVTSLGILSKSWWINDVVYLGITNSIPPKKRFFTTVNVWYIICGKITEWRDSFSTCHCAYLKDQQFSALIVWHPKDVNFTYLDYIFYEFVNTPFHFWLKTKISTILIQKFILIHSKFLKTLSIKNVIKRGVFL